MPLVQRQECWHKGRSPTHHSLAFSQQLIENLWQILLEAHNISYFKHYNSNVTKESVGGSERNKTNPVMHIDLRL